jgi:6-pyruvoyl-tetrahydropterin synthase
MSLTEIIKVYKLSYIEHEDELQKQKLNTLINMGKTILDNIDPEWKIKLEGENVGMTDKLIKEFIKQNTGDSIYEN